MQTATAGASMQTARKQGKPNDTTQILLSAVKSVKKSFDTFFRGFLKLLGNYLNFTNIHIGRDLVV